MVRSQLVYSYYAVGAQEVAWLLGVSRERVDQLTAVEGFPVPVADHASGPQWNKSEIEAWVKDTDWVAPRVESTEPPAASRRRRFRRT